MADAPLFDCFACTNCVHVFRFEYDRHALGNEVYKNKIAQRKEAGVSFGFKHGKKVMLLLKNLNSDMISSADKNALAEKELYPNGIVGRANGQAMSVLLGYTNGIAAEVRWFTDSGQIFDVLTKNSQLAPPLWTGKQFRDAMKRRQE